MQEWYLGWEKVSCLERCPQFRSVLIEREVPLYTHSRRECSDKEGKLVGVASNSLRRQSKSLRVLLYRSSRCFPGNDPCDLGIDMARESGCAGEIDARADIKWFIWGRNQHHCCHGNCKTKTTTV